MPEVNPQRVVAAFKSAKRWAYREKDLSLAWLHVSRTFGISIAEVRRMVYEAKPPKEERPEVGDKG